MEAIRDLILDAIEEIVFYRVSPDELLISGHILDSIALVDLAVAIDSRTGVKIPFNEINEENFDTVNRIITYLNQRMNDSN